MARPIFYLCHTSEVAGQVGTLVLKQSDIELPLEAIEKLTF